MGRPRSSARSVIALLIKTFLFQAFYIPSDSMVPTLKIHDRVIVNKLSYKLHSVHRGDIVVFKAPPDVDPAVNDLVKRVIGLPGETIEGRTDGHIYINGKLLERAVPAQGHQARARTSRRSRSPPTRTGSWATIVPTREIPGSSPSISSGRRTSSDVCSSASGP